MKIQFIGATHEVTGSCTLLEVCGKKYLVDCGMEQGIDVFENVSIPVPANTIESVFLTHAHIDHIISISFAILSLLKCVRRHDTFKQRKCFSVENPVLFTEEGLFLLSQVHKHRG